MKTSRYLNSSIAIKPQLSTCTAEKRSREVAEDDLKLTNKQPQLYLDILWVIALQGPAAQGVDAGPLKILKCARK